MSEHATDTVIGNKDETIRRLIAERDAWKKIAQEFYGAMRVAAEIVKKCEQKGVSLCD